MRRAAGGFLLLFAACASGPSPGDARLLYQEALHRLARNEPPDEILPLLDRAIERDPEQARFYMARAGVRILIRRPDAALEDYGAALHLQSTPAERSTTLVQRGLLHAEARRLAAAESDFSAALELLPEHVEARLQRAHLRRLAGRITEADEDLALAREHGKKLADTFFNEGVRNLNLRRLKHAERYFRFTVEIKEDHNRAHLALARVCMELRRFEDAARSLTRAIELKPDDASLYYHRANASLARNLFEEAVQDYTRAIERNPDFAAAYAARGKIYLRPLRKFTLAEQDLARALARDPRNYEAYLSFGILYHELTLLNHAERSLKTALRLRASPDAAHALGRVLHDKGEFEHAADVYREALKICRDDSIRGSIERDLAETEAAILQENRK